ncbi:MAG: hypothetical protein H7Z14_18360 [Anaerolineae bacterium]|nr:hypothetical protein [Phycisphaerae bacterium]
MQKTLPIIDRLLKSSEPSICFKIRVGVLGETENSALIRRLRNEIRESPRVRSLLQRQDKETGEICCFKHLYDKWQGTHWILASLADLGYPTGDRSLHAARDQVVDFWLGENFYKEFDARGAADVYKSDGGVPRIEERYRRCGSQQGNALWSIETLGMADKRSEKLVERLLHWQWPDGGWNCDKNPSADTSSFMETLLPMRALALYDRTHKHKRAREAARRAAEVFLSRRLFKQRSDGKIIRREFTQLHYPLYWHYDILGGLKVLAEMDLLHDERCNDALDLLESKQLPDGGWPATSRYYSVSSKQKHGADFVDWGGTGARKMNEWITADALFVLHRAGRLKS